MAGPVGSSGGTAGGAGAGAFVKPPRLRPGDTVCAVSLSSGAAARFPDRYRRGRRQFEEAFGVNVVEAPHALRDDAWLYAHPEARAEDLHWALENPEVRGIVSVIGGDESVRILPHLDHELIRAHPKPFMGFSDATVTLTAFQNAGVVAFHGPALMTDLAEAGGIKPYVRRSVSRALFEGWTGPLEHSPEWTEQFLDWGDPAVADRPRTFLPSEGPVWLQGGSAVTGRLTGGNVEVLEFLKGTPWWPRPESWEGVVLCLETSEEAPPVTLVGRFLRNYGSQGILERAAALLLARPMRYSAEQHWRLQEEALRVLAEFGRRDMPVVANLDLGHTSPQTVLPFGCMAEVDPVGRRVVLLEPGVA